MSAETEEIRFSYKGVPTLRDFARDNRPIRSVVGPFGPVSGDTEYLTPTGWKRMDQYKKGDQIAQWHEDGRMEFVKPSAYIVTPSDGFIHIHNMHSVSMMVSPCHRVPLYDHRNKLKVYTGQYIADHPGRHRVPTTFTPEFDDYPISDDELRLRIAINADGHFPKNSTTNRVTVCLRKERKKRRLAALLHDLGIEYVVRTGKNRPTEQSYRFNAPAREKTYQGWWWTLSARQLEIVIDEMSHWDGLYEGVDTRFSTTSKPCADFMQYAAHAIGGRATIKSDKKQSGPKGWSECYAVHIAKPGSRKAPAYIRGGTEIEWTSNPSGKQYCFRTASSFFIARHNGCVFVTGNSGKTSATGPIEIIRRGNGQQAHPDGIKRTRFVVVRNTYAQLEDTTVKTFMEWLPEDKFGVYTKSSHTYVIEAIPNCHIEVIFRALDRPDHVRNILGLELTGGLLNEAREIPWAIIGPLYGRTGRYPSGRTGVPCTWHGIWMDSNAPAMNHWLYRLTMKKNLSEDEAKMLKMWGAYRQPGGREPTAENLDNLPLNYYDDMAMMMTEDQVRVYIDNQFGYLKQGKPVYEEWRDNLHLRSQLKPQDNKFTILRGWDFGLTPSCLLAYVTPRGQLRFFKEFTTKRAGMLDFGKEVIKWCNQNLKDFKFDDWGDPSGDAGRDTSDTSGFEVLEGLGVQIEGADNGLFIRIESMKYGLSNIADGEAEIVVDGEECPVLVEGFQGGYEFGRLLTRDERFKEEPSKNEYSHPHDAAQYISQKVFGDLVLYKKNEVDNMRAQSRQITEDVQPGYRVPTPYEEDDDDWTPSQTAQIVDR